MPDCPNCKKLNIENNVLRSEVGYWKNCHQQALEREALLKLASEELEAKIKLRERQLFGRRSEKGSDGSEQNETDLPDKTKCKRGQQLGAEGIGWIALALVIFGGWNPVKAACGAYLFAFLQVMGIYLQGWFPSVPAQVFQVAPFPLMIFTLVIMFALQKESVMVVLDKRPLLKYWLRLFSASPPAALGKQFLRQ